MPLRRWVKSPGHPVAPPPSFEERITLPSGLTVGFRTIRSDADGISCLAREWQHLETKAENSFFLGWPWVETWLLETVCDTPLILAEVKNDSLTIGLALLPLLERRVAGLRSRVVCFNELPLPGRDMIAEKNGCLAQAGYERESFGAIVDALTLSGLRVDEVLCRAIDARYLGGWRDSNFRPVAHDKTACCWLLGKGGAKNVEKQPLDFASLLGSLSKGRRWQMRRFFKLAEMEYGPIRFDQAETETTAAEYFKELGLLHTAYWQRQGKPGVFGSASWRSFHWRLITRLLPNGGVQLARLSAGDEPIGYLYNVIHREEVCNIQSGFQYLADNRWRPGYVSHLLAADAAEKHGCSRYDLLMGDDQYKASIAREGTRLHWFSLFPRKRIFNARYRLWQMLECYRRVRTSSKPKAQGDSRS